MAARFLLLCLALALAACGSGGGRPAPAQAAERMEPDFKEAARINTELGVNYARSGNYDVALEKFQRALEQNENHAPAHQGIAFIYAQRGDVERADAHYQRALRLAPRDSRTRNNYAIFLCGREQYQAAEKLFVQAAEDRENRQRHAAYTNAGVCARRIPDLEKAEGYFLRALKVAPDFPEALQQLSGVYLEQKFYAKSRDFLRRYERVGPPTPITLWIGAKVEFALGDELAAARYAERLREEFPDSKESQSFTSAS